MTTTLETPPAQLWNTMPGWGIAANLLPPEIVTARRVRVLRKMVIVAIAGVVLLGAGGYVYGRFQKSDAQSALSAAQNQTATLQSQQRKYGVVVSMAGDIDSVKSQLASLLGTDVDFSTLLNNLVTHAPAGTISTLTVVMNSPSQTSAALAIPDPAGDLPVGTVSISGSTSSMAEVAAAVIRISHIRGVVEAYPTSQQNDGKNVKYTLTLTLVDKVFSHRYDLAAAAPKTGGK